MEDYYSDYEDYSEDYNGYNEDNPIILNSSAKLRSGGRKAPVISMDEFKSKIPSNVYDMMYLSKISSDISKFEFDLENIMDGSYGTTESGIPYFTVECGGDWEIPVLVFIYWDGKSLRGYVPTRGNTINLNNKSALGNSDECEVVASLEDYTKKELEMYHKSDFKLIMQTVYPYESDKWIPTEENLWLAGNLLELVRVDQDLCLDDFESRLDVIQ